MGVWPFAFSFLMQLHRYHSMLVSRLYVAASSVIGPEQLNKHFT